MIDLEPPSNVMIAERIISVRVRLNGRFCGVPLRFCNFFFFFFF